MKDNSELRWDFYFMDICDVVAKNSKCMSRKIGSILVKDRAIISTGYNGPVRELNTVTKEKSQFYFDLDGRPEYLINDCILEERFKDTCPRKLLDYKSSKGLHLCQAGHAERNVLIQAARNGISTLDTILYCNCGQVCKDCAIEIVNAGVKELVYLDGYPDYDSYSSIILVEGRIKVRKIYQNAV